MEKEFVPYELSVKLKAIGFDEPCFAGYRDSEWIGTDGPNSRYFHAQLFSNHQFDEDQQGYCSAPLFQQVFRWFREPKNGSLNHLDFMYEYLKDDSMSYEEAELACLSKLIEIVETRTKSE